MELIILTARENLLNQQLNNMIIKENYLYQNKKTGKHALGVGDDLVEYEDAGQLALDFYMLNNGKIEKKYVTVLDDEWKNTPKKLKKK